MGGIFHSITPTSIPAKTEAGTYYVWYKVVGDSGHADTTPASVPVTISSKAMTVSATGYTGYPDGKAHGITVTVTDPATGVTVKYGEAQGTYAGRLGRSYHQKAELSLMHSGMLLLYEPGRIYH